MLPKAILFDLDNTLARYKVSQESAWKKAFEIAADDLDFSRTDELLNVVNTVRKWYWSDPERHRAGRLNMNDARKTILRMALKELDCVNEKAIDKVATAYMDSRESSLDFFPDTENMLDELVERKVKLALLTNGAQEAQQSKIDRLGLARYFPVRLIEGELGYGKPDRRVFESALNELEITAGEAWMVGDDINRDIAGAQKTGILAIWHDFENSGLPEDAEVFPDKIINSTKELLNL